MSTQAPINMPPAHGDLKLQCGGCKWFVQGYGGSTCQQVRHVVATTRACIEFQRYQKSSFEEIERDKFIVELRKTVRVFTESGLKTMADEIKQYRLYAKTLSDKKDPMSFLAEEEVAKLAHNFEICQSYFDRLYDTRELVLDKYLELQSLAKDVQAYLFTNYRDLFQGLKNDTERNALFRAAAPDLVKAIEKMENLKDKVDFIYDNLRNTHFAMSRKQEGVLEVLKARVQAASSTNRSSRTSG